MAHQLNLLLLTLGALQGVVVSFFLLGRKKAHPSLIYLILFLVVIGLQLTFKAASKAWLWENVRLIYRLTYSLPFLVGPLLFLFVRNRIKPAPFKPIELLHFVPFVLFFLNLYMDEVYASGFMSYVFGSLLPWPSRELISLFAYGLLSLHIARKAEDKNARSLRNFLVFVFATETVIVLTVVLLVYNPGLLPYLRWVFITLTFLIYWMSYKLLADPELFLLQEKGVATLIKGTTIKYAHSGLKPEEADRILRALYNAVYEDKVLLECDVPIDVMAARIRVPRHHLSRVINEKLNKSYVEFVNGWRLDEAKSRLMEARFKDLKLAAIALDCGFKSVSTFNTMFKRQFQVTPSEFRSGYHKKLSA